MSDQAGQNSRTWALNRMCLVDSYSPGRVVEFDVAGGAALAGRNGEGKTTLLSILPLFHGETPSRLVRKGANRQGFVKHYLGRTSSYIVFEYVREEGDVCMSVLYANADGTTVNQRFVRSSFDASLFISDDGRSFLPTRELRERLSIRKIASSNVNDLSGYRNILHATPQNREQAQDCQIYSITPPGHPIPGVERIINGMFQRTTNFSDIAAIVVRNVQEGDDPIQLKAKRDQVQWWVRDYDAYTAVMAVDHRWRASETADVDVREARDRLGRMIARLDGFMLHAKSERHRIDLEIREIATAENRLQDDDMPRLQIIRASQGSLNKERDQAERECRIHQDAIQRHVSQNLERSAGEVDSLPDIEKTLTSLGQRKSALEGQAGSISTSYERMMVDERSRAVEDANALQRRADRRRQEINAAMASADHKAGAARSEQQASTKDAQDAMDARVEEATHRKAAAAARLANPAVNSAVQEARDAAAGSHAAARDRHEAARTALACGESKLRNAKEALQMADRHVGLAKTRHTVAVDVLKEAKAIMQGPEGSILRFARDHAPASLDAITRSLPTAILLRTDLSPNIADGRMDAAFGISFDVGRLPEDPARDMQAARIRVEAAETEERDATSNYQAAEDALRKAGATHASAAQALRPLQAEEAASLGRMREESALERRAIATHEEARRQAIEVARQEVASTADDLEKAHAARMTMRAAHAEAALRIDLDNENEKVALRRDLTALETSLSERISHTNAQRDAAIAALTKERDNALRREGVDVEAVREIAGRIDALRANRIRIGDLVKEVAAWRHWNEVEPPRQNERLLRITEINHELTELTARIEVEDKRIRQEAAHLRRRREELNQQRTNIVQDEARVTERIKGLEQFRTNASEDWRPQDDLGSTLRDASSAKTRVHESEQRRDGALRDLDAVFNVHPSSGPFSYLHDGSFATDGAGDRLAGYRSWYETRHVETRSRIADTAETLSRNIGIFRDGLLEFRRSLLAFNRDIQKYLSDIAVFESLTGLEIDIRPSFDKLEYWPRIEAVAETARAMAAAGGERGSLPDVAFREAVGSLLPLWSSATAIRADLASLIHISGKVSDKGVVKTFQTGTELGEVSSNGLSYLVLASILTAFVDRIRKNSPATIVWAVDELRDLDAINAAALVAMLKGRNIEIVSAFTDVDSGIMRHFANRYAMRTGRRIQRVLLQDRRSREPSLSLVSNTEREPVHVL